MSPGSSSRYRAFDREARKPPPQLFVASGLTLGFLNCMKSIRSFFSIDPVAAGGSILAATLRVVPHPFNFSSVGALSLYSGARLSGPAVFILPLLLMVVSDWALALKYGTGTWTLSTPFVYAAFLINIFAGKLLRSTENPFAIGALAVAANAQFFLVSNFGVWATSGMYSMDMSGLVTCFVAAIPFYQAALIGDIVFSVVLFGLHSVLVRTGKLQRVRSH